MFRGQALGPVPAGHGQAGDDRRAPYPPGMLPPIVDSDPGDETTAAPGA